MTGMDASTLDLVTLRRRFFAGGDMPDEAVSGTVLRSWRRLRAGQPAVPRPEPSAVLFELSAAAAPEVDYLARSVEGAGCAVVLVNARAQAMQLAGAAAALRQAGLWRGTDCSELRLGTNAWACALLEQRTVAVAGAEHTAPAWAGVHSLAAPVFDPCGYAIGALGLLRALGPEPAAKTDLAALVQSLAQAIELRLVEQVRPDVVLQLGLRGALEGSWARICLDRRGAVQAINRGARQLLGWSESRPESFVQLFGEPFRPWLAALRLHPEGLPLRSTDGLLLWARATARRAAPVRDARKDRERTLGALTSQAMGQALAQAGGNVSAAARALGISRSTLHRWLRKA